jgi:hypothetical protein
VDTVRPIIGWPVGPLLLEVLLASGQDIVSPAGQPMCLDL